MNGLFDTHCHLMSHLYHDENIESIVEDAKLIGVNLICNVGYDLETSKIAVDQAVSSPNIFAAVGIHPNDTHEHNETTYDELEKLVQTGNVIAIGEIGLDYYRSQDTKEIQVEWFKKQINLAKKYNLPVLVHTRDAWDDCYQILLEAEVKGIMHCYTGDIKTALKLIDLGFYISFAGNITFNNATALQEVVKGIPLNRIVLETDAPYLTPNPYRGTRNYPKNIIFTAKKVAALKQIPLSEVINMTTNNAKRILNIN